MNQTTEIVDVKAGEKIEIFSRSFSSVPMTYEFTATAAEGTELLGRVETHAKGSLGKKQIKTFKLQASNSVKASMWDTFFTVYVVAEIDLQVTMPKRKLGYLRSTILLVLVLVMLASALIISQIQ